MSKSVILTVGPAGCGKSTYARNEALNNPSKVMVVNRDDIRSMLYGLGSHTNGMQHYKHSKANEKHVTAAQFAIAESFKNSDFETLIVADTNLNPRTREKWKTWCGFNGIQMTVRSSWIDINKHGQSKPITLPILIERNQYRGSEAIPLAVLKRQWDMFMDYKGLAKAVDLIDETLPKCVIFDIDGTLAHKGKRDIYDFSQVHVDSVDEHVKFLLNSYKEAGYKIVICTGRSSGGTTIDTTFLDITKDWLNKNGIHFDEIYGRRGGDYRADHIVKEEILLESIIKKFNPVLVVDDRNQVVDMWRSHGLKCYQVAAGDFN